MKRVPELRREVSQSHRSAPKEEAWQELIKADSTTVTSDPPGHLLSPLCQ